MQATEEMILAVFENRFKKLKNLCIDNTSCFCFSSTAITIADKTKVLVDELLFLAEELKKLKTDMSKEST